VTDKSQPATHAKYGFACSGSLSPTAIAEAAGTAERLGYANFWITVLRERTDPVAVLEAALSATTGIEIGLGLVPLDAFNPAAFAQRLHDLPPRTIIGLGVGRTRLGAPAVWRSGAEAVRREAPELRIAVGSYGRGVLRAAGAIADAVLLNWMTPSQAAWAGTQFDAGSRTAGRFVTDRPRFVYVPAAIGQGATDRLSEARQAMAHYDYFQRHQAALGDETPVGIAVDPAATGRVQLPDLGRGTRSIIHPIASMNEEQIAQLMHVFAPCVRQRAPSADL
jgi:alkanesulfonate monooxygenase SsuD/methylene tetrahydromethanopterin reductase-like flavin-dependent oxidoreductase (luciferase family)